MATPDTIKQALERAANLLSLRPAKGQRTYTSTATVTNGLSCRIDEGSQTLIADLPPSMGGENEGPSPSMLLRAALTSCTAIGVKMWAARRDVPVEQVEVSLETDVDARGQFGVCDDITPGFEAIRLSIRVSSSAPRETIEEIVETALRYSPLTDVFARPQRVETDLDITATA